MNALNNNNNNNNVLCMHNMPIYFCTFFSVNTCVLRPLLWAASYDGLMPPLAACHCSNWCVIFLLSYLVNKLCLSTRDKCNLNTLLSGRAHLAVCLPAAGCCYHRHQLLLVLLLVPLWSDVYTLNLCIFGFSYSPLSCLFHPCDVVPHFPVLHFPVKVNSVMVDIHHWHCCVD